MQEEQLQLEMEEFRTELAMLILVDRLTSFDDDVDEAPVQELALNEDNVFQADQCDAFDSDVDEAPITQTMFMANLSSADLIYDDAGPSYDSDILYELQDHDSYLDSVDGYHEVHKMQNDVQPNYVVDSDVEYMSDSNIISYEQHVMDNSMQVVQSNVSSVPNDYLMMIINDMHEQAAQCVSVNEQNKVVNVSLTAELARYKKIVEVYEKRARFELTEREQKIDEQMRIIITNHNIKEETLKKELHSIKMQLNSTIDHNKLTKEEVATLKKYFKQKENKYLKEVLDMKELKEKVEDKLYKQDQSLQIVHMLCKPKPYYDEKKKVAIGYKNPLYLTSAMQVQSALYNGHEIVKTNHAPTVVNDSEDNLKLAEITRKRMLKKVKTLYVLKKSEKTYKKRITPSGLTEGERGFEQTNECYLTKVIRFFKTLKEHFEGIQTALAKEVKEMKDIFEQVEAKVEQKAVDKQCADIERNNLLIENENLIAICLSNELLYSVMNDVNTGSRFFELHDAYTVRQVRCLELKAEISKLKHKIEKDDHSEMIKHFSNLEVNQLNLQLKYQNL
ncbi:hypothetical protein Tco_1423265, partial [Tanacetum coccineum]